MLYELLNQQNPEFDLLHLQKLQAFYRGSRSIRALIHCFITKNEFEDNKRYAQRKEQAPYLNYTGPIIDKFAAMLMASPPNAQVSKDTGEQDEPGEDWLDWASNVDGNGTDLTQFMREQFTDSLMKKRAIWTLKLPSDEGVPAASLAEWRTRNLGQIQLEELETQDCIDWHCDDKGQLLWLIHHTSETPRETPGQSRNVVVETWRVFDREVVTTYQIRYKVDEPPKPDQDIPQLGEPWVHGLGECPIITLEMPDGLWVADRIYESQLEHFRISAALSWAFKAACYAMALFYLVDSSKLPVMGEGLGVLLDKDDKVDWLSPPVAHLAIMQSEKAALKDEIYRIIHQMADSSSNNAGTIGRSGVSKSADLFSTRTILESFAQLVRSAIERTYYMAARLRGTDQDVKWSITGLDQFDDLNLAELIEAITGIDAIGMPSNVYQREIRRMVLDAILPNLDEATRAKALDEVEKGMQKLQDQKDAEAQSRIELQQTMVEGAHVANQLNGAVPPATPGKPGTAKAGPAGKGAPPSNASGGRAPFGRGKAAPPRAK
jgi:hypothetical protein